MRAGAIVAHVEGVGRVSFPLGHSGRSLDNDKGPTGFRQPGCGRASRRPPARLGERSRVSLLDRALTPWCAASVSAPARSRSWPASWYPRDTSSGCQTPTRCHPAFPPVKRDTSANRSCVPSLPVRFRANCRQIATSVVRRRRHPWGRLGRRAFELADPYLQLNSKRQRTIDGKPLMSRRYSRRVRDEGGLLWRLGRLSTSRWVVSAVHACSQPPG